MRVAAFLGESWGYLGMNNNRDYFARRADEERSAADRATNDKAREAHRQMAKHYEEQAGTAPTERYEASASAAPAE
jgi:hypothetical protein